jgi:metallophosphoesterase superfamily enzyme
LFVGDLSYANDYPFHDNTRWDTWGRFVERVAAYQPWIWTAGNHEIDYAPEIVCIISIVGLLLASCFPIFIERLVLIFCVSLWFQP